MPREIEIKLRCDDLATVRRRLEAIRATPHGAVQEVNTLFDTPEGTLRAGDCGLRLRETVDLCDAAVRAAWLTFKGPRAAGAVKHREELETGLATPAAIRELLPRLGYQPVLVYEKRRETWTWEGCEICLDTLPRLGTFVEVEGPDEATIQRARDRLALADAAVEPATYVELTARHGDRDATGVQRLEFPLES
jgi:predicted adenylyl cyclase CyaB